MGHGGVRMLTINTLRPLLGPVSHPEDVPEPVFATHEEWARGAKSIYDVELGRSTRIQRAIYKMQGHVVFLETCFPWNPFEHVTTSMLVETFNVPRNSDEMRLAMKHGGEWEEGYYAEPGFGWPRFCGDDCTERCWNFLKEYEAGKLAKAVRAKKKQE